LHAAPPFDRPVPIVTGLSKGDRNERLGFSCCRINHLCAGRWCAVSELSAFLSRGWNDTWYMQLYAFSGFSDNSPDWGVGILFEIG